MVGTSNQSDPGIPIEPLVTESGSEHGNEVDPVHVPWLSDHRRVCWATTEKSALYLGPHIRLLKKRI
jgi:hypothetical protein